jgi:hypothetical protein
VCAEAEAKGEVTLRSNPDHDLPTCVQQQVSTLLPLDEPSRCSPHPTQRNGQILPHTTVLCSLKTLDGLDDTVNEIFDHPDKVEWFDFSFNELTTVGEVTSSLDPSPPTATARVRC